MVGIYCACEVLASGMGDKAGGSRRVAASALDERRAASRNAVSRCGGTNEGRGGDEPSGDDTLALRLRFLLVMMVAVALMVRK